MDHIFSQSDPAEGLCTKLLVLVIVKIFPDSNKNLQEQNIYNPSCNVAKVFA